MDRRSFLKLMAAAAALPLLPAEPVWVGELAPPGLKPDVWAHWYRMTALSARDWRVYIEEGRVE